jgi:hypothetical protein
MPRKKRVPELDHRGTLITFTDAESEQCLGYLLDAGEHGVFEPSFGKVDVTPAEAKLHNQVLDQALIDGLNNHCEVGHGGMFYLRDGQVVTWLRTVVAPALVRPGRHCTCVRAGKELRATKRRRSDDDTIWVQRIS